MRTNAIQEDSCCIKESWMEKAGWIPDSYLGIFSTKVTVETLGGGGDGMTQILGQETKRAEKRALRKTKLMAQTD